MPDQGRGFFAREPTISRLALWRQRHPHDASMKTFLRMVVDGRAKRLEVASGAACVTAMLDIAGASLCIDLRQHLATPVLVETIKPCLDLKLFAGLSNVGGLAEPCDELTSEWSEQLLRASIPSATQYRMHARHQQTGVTGCIVSVERLSA